MTTPFSRRNFLVALAASLAPVPSIGRTAPLCPTDPAISDVNAPLTIDVHTHIFNGRDLQIRQFFAKTTVQQGSELYPFANAMGAVLQTLGWHLAPNAESERRAIAQYGAEMRNCGGAETLRTLAAPAFEEGYAVGRRELQAAAQTLNQTPQGAAVLGPKTKGGSRLEDAIRSLPPTYKGFEAKRTQPGVLGSNPTLLGYLRFILHNFNHRHVNAIDYLTTYSRNSSRKVDLVVASMVDYDWWLAQGKQTPTTLAEQVDLMGEISVLLGGRVHGFAPFCPFREAMTKGADGIGDSMRLVKRAVETQGFLGVKLYPPMGFAPWGNTGQTIWVGKPGLPAAASDPAFGEHLDAAMETLFKYCTDNGVPIMAHSNHSNGPDKAFLDLAGSEYWSKALGKFPGLRASFGHFGDTDLEDHQGDKSRKFLDLMSSAAGSAGANIFADSGYFAGVLSNQSKMTQVLQTLYAASDNHVLRERLMYGTDWTMILPQKNVDDYLSDFIDVMGKVEAAQHGVTVRQTTLSNAFFGHNAAEFLGLKSGMVNRRRLETFYAANKVPEPDWMRKVG